MTTLEVSNVGRYGYMGGKPSITSNAQVGSSHSHGSSGGESEDHVHGANCDHSKKNSSSKGGKTNFLLKILGIDRFTSGKAAEGIAKSGTIVNPFDLGFIRNCTDFWTAGKELGVDYSRIYEVPVGGFSKAVADRKRRTAAGNSTASTGVGYERVAMNEV